MPGGPVGEIKLFFKSLIHILPDINSQMKIKETNIDFMANIHRTKLTNGYFFQYNIPYYEDND